jgi:hypothetical protein
LDQVFAPFLVTGVPTALEQFGFGQIFWTPAYYPHQQLEIWRPAVVDQKLHWAKNFNIQTGLIDAFNRQLAYFDPHLKHNEGFIALRAKRRPVMLVRPPDAELLKVGKTSGGLKLVRRLCVVAPLFSIVDDIGDAKVPAEFRDRVRQLEYPQFVLFPNGGPIQRDSILRLDELQSVAINNLEHTGFRLAADIEAVLRSQAAFFLTGTGGDEFVGYRELHGCPATNRTESTGFQYRLSRYRSRMSEVPVRWGFSRIELG